MRAAEYGFIFDETDRRVKGSDEAFSDYEDDMCQKLNSAMILLGSSLKIMITAISRQ